MRAVEQMRRLEEIALQSEQRRAAATVAAVARHYAAAGLDPRQTCMHFSLFRNRIARLDRQHTESAAKADMHRQAIIRDDGRLRRLAERLERAVDAEERKTAEKELAERLATSLAGPVSGKP